ncbi:hypothetical protein [Candidatus Symbiobacter mobilis]|uniref:Uncharacterized protein n=1 Tax=Candidatus Symbiobacter mobilis CR TaxID=946483 RepID=U5NAH6_9BURK|nr:hypothetical protein [Candidatus Symbiobacter mobilis]AGX88320.1 hypothetical protein Cenrod_2256 [Candidatus Symbiobacter mobilis CR]
MNLEPIKSYLEEEGFRPKYDEDSDIRFKFEGKTYYIQTIDEDEEYIILLAANIWPIENEEESIKAYQNTNEVTRNIKVAKVYVTPYNNVYATIELFLPNPETFIPIFIRCLGALDKAVSEFRTAMQEENKGLIQ